MEEEFHMRGTHRQKVSNVHLVNVTSWNVLLATAQSTLSFTLIPSVSCNKHMVEKTCASLLKYKMLKSAKKHLCCQENVTLNLEG